MTTIEDLLVEAYSHWDDADVLDRTGRELHDRNRLGPARAVLERALEIKPDGDPETWAELSFAYMRGYDHERGLDALRRGIEATGSDALRSTLASYTDDEEEKTKLRESLADCDMPSVRASAISERLFKGQDEALQELIALRDEFSADDEIAHVLCWAVMSGLRAGKLQEDEAREMTLPYLDRHIAEEPGQAGRVIFKLMILEAMEDWTSVLEQTARSLENFPDEESLWRSRGKAFRETGDAMRAVACLNRAVGAKPSFAGARVDLGKTYETMGRVDLAEEVFREIPDANPGYPGGPVSLSLFLARHEKWDEAEATFIEAYPNLPAWMQGGLSANPDAAGLLARPKVKAILGETEE